MNSPFRSQLFHKILREVGEASATPFEWKLTSTDPHGLSYGFTTDSGVDYTVLFAASESDTDNPEGVDINNTRGVTIYFAAKEGDEEYSIDKVVSKGEMYKVMSTIVSTVKDVLHNYPNIEYLNYLPGAKWKEPQVDNQRGKLYMSYIKKQLPNATIKSDPKTGDTNIYLPQN